MNIDQLKAKFPDEDACRHFFESIIWQKGRICSHCQCQKSYHISGPSDRPGLYECARCKQQFTVTIKTPMHSSKLPLWKWLVAQKNILLIQTSYVVYKICPVYLGSLLCHFDKSLTSQWLIATKILHTT